MPPSRRSFRFAWEAYALSAITRTGFVRGGHYLGAAPSRSPSLRGTWASRRPDRCQQERPVAAFSRRTVRGSSSGSGCAAAGGRSPVSQFSTARKCLQRQSRESGLRRYAAVRGASSRASRGTALRVSRCTGRNASDRKRARNPEWVRTPCETPSDAAVAVVLPRRNFAS